MLIRSILERDVQHKWVHSGEKPFASNVDVKTFGLEDDTNKNIRVHSVEKPFACNDCGTFFVMQAT